MRHELKWFGIGVVFGFILLGLIIGKVKEIHTPFGKIVFVQKENQLQPQTEMIIEGKVKDIFDNPRKDVIVIIREMEKHTVTNEEGRYHFPTVPDCDNITFEARYGQEKCSRQIIISRDVDVIETVKTDNVEKKIVKVKQPLILENPNIKVEAVLCENVDGHTPVNPFEEENPRIPIDIGTIRCFIRVFGPLGYETDKTTKITYSWYYNGSFLSKYDQEVGFNPATGWRTNASKSLYGLTGKWRLDIQAKHKKFKSLHFETY